MKLKDVSRFVCLVGDMRMAQKLASQDPSPDNFADAAFFETQVDDMRAEMMRQLRDPRQGKLLNE